MILRRLACAVPNDHKSKRYIHAYEHTRTPRDLSISAVATPSHSLWLYDHNLPPTWAPVKQKLSKDSASLTRNHL